MGLGGGQFCNRLFELGVTDRGRELSHKPDHSCAFSALGDLDDSTEITIEVSSSTVRPASSPTFDRVASTRRAYERLDRSSSLELLSSGKTGRCTRASERAKSKSAVRDRPSNQSSKWNHLQSRPHIWHPSPHRQDQGIYSRNGCRETTTFRKHLF
jgi:hypothetical protein